MMIPRRTRLALPEKIAMTTSDSDANTSREPSYSMGTEALIRRVIFVAESLYDLETMRKPYTPTTAVRVDRLMEALTNLVDELARRS